MGTTSWPHSQAECIETVDDLIKRAHASLSRSDVTVSPSKVSRVIRRYVRDTSIAATSKIVDGLFMPSLPSAAQALWYDIATMNNRHIDAPTEDDQNRRIAVPVPVGYKALPSIPHMRFGSEAKLYGPEDKTWGK